MREPKRLLEDAEIEPEMQALLRSIAAPTAPGDEKLLALGQQLALAGASGAATIGAAGWLKLALAGGAVLLAAGGYLLLRPSAPAPTTSVLATAAPSSQLPQIASTPPAPVLPLPSAEPAASRSSMARSEVSADSLAEEAQLLERARRVRRSAPSEALALLDQHRQKYPRGELAAERLFLSVEVWERLGNEAMSDKQAAALIQRYPGSVYATQLKARRQR